MLLFCKPADYQVYILHRCNSELAGKGYEAKAQS